MLINICNYSFYQDFSNYGSNGEGNDEKATKPVREQRQPININKNDKNDKNDKNSNINPLTPLEEAIEEFKKHRAKMKKPMTDRAVALLMSKLDKLAGDDDELKIAILEQSIFNGWQGVFDLKDGFQPAKAEQPPPSKPRTGHMETRPGAYGVPEEIWVEDAEC